MAQKTGETTGFPVAELLTPLGVYSHAVEVRELTGYTNDKGIHIPIWGDRLAVYHPVKSELTHLSEDAWTVFDSLRQENQSVDTMAKKTGIDPERATQIATELQDRWILLPQKEELQVTIKPQFDNETELYLEATEACNFRCPGCATGVDRYLKGEAKTMDEPTLHGVLENAIRSNAEKGIKKLRVKWAGGEVLMPMPFKLVKNAQEVIERLKKTYPVEISQVILTNGAYLTEQTVQAIKEFDNTHVSVSLWGIGEENNKARRPLGANGNYENIVKGIERLNDAGISFNVNHVVTPWNANQFGQFLTTMWDTTSEDFVGKNWKWNGDRQPIPLGISFFRPQTKEQLVYLQEQGYTQMVEGLRSGFEVMRSLIESGHPTQPLDKIDYLQLFGVIPAPCGSGFNYLAIGPKGATSCHEGLFEMEANMNQVVSGRVNLLDLVNREYMEQLPNLIGANINFPTLDSTTGLILALHGGSGCPRTARVENDGQLGTAASTASLLYAPILEELLSLETMRRLRAN